MVLFKIRSSIVRKRFLSPGIIYRPEKRMLQYGALRFGFVDLRAGLEEGAFVFRIGVTGVLVEEVVDHFVAPGVEASDFDGVRRDIFAGAAGLVIFAGEGGRHHNDGDFFKLSLLGVGADFHLIKCFLKEVFRAGIDKNPRGGGGRRVALSASANGEQEEKSRQVI